jgi:uncharacterized protein YtpQ (UPF0354 family)
MTRDKVKDIPVASLPETEKEGVELGTAPFPVPRIKSNKFIELVQYYINSADDIPIYSPLVGDLIVAYSFDIGDFYVSATPSTCKQYNVELNDLPALALANALRLGADIKLLGSDDLLFILEAKNDMQGCVILFTDIWERLSKFLKSDLVAIFPQRNTILFARASSEKGIDGLIEMLKIFDFNGTYSQSALLYLFSNSKWSVYNKQTIPDMC